MRGPRVIPAVSGRIFAIGDIHGCPAELEALLNHLVGGAKLGAADLVVFIGDYVDRGPSSRDAIQLLVKFQQQYPATIFLRGNHDDMLLSFLGLGGARGDFYLDNGGIQCLKSYGVAAPYHPQEARLRIPGDHLQLLSQTEYAVVSDSYLFAHAGIDPLRDQYSQISDDLIWIRDEFIERRHHLGKTVVFGHTPYQDVLFMLPHKIGIDTGLVYGNKLTCLELPSMTLHQIRLGERQVLRTVFETRSVGSRDTKDPK